MNKTASIALVLIGTVASLVSGCVAPSQVQGPRLDPGLAGAAPSPQQQGAVANVATGDVTGVRLSIQQILPWALAFLLTLLILLLALIVFLSHRREVHRIKLGGHSSAK